MSDYAPARRLPGESRLVRMLERFTTQRVCLDHVAALVADREGLVLEVGLGKGRTYDHLRRCLPDHRFLVFDREVHAIEDCVPPAQCLRLGDFRDTLPRVAEESPGQAILIHADIGSEDEARDRALTRDLTEAFARLLAPCGILVSDRSFEHPRWREIALPPGTGRWSYHVYQAQD